MVTTVPDGDGEPLSMEGIFPKLSETPGEIRHAGGNMGADNEAVFGGAWIAGVWTATRAWLLDLVPEERASEAFGLYALSGKATSFLAPALIALATHLSGSQQVGVSPLILLFGIGLVLLVWVKPDGDRAA